MTSSEAAVRGRSLFLDFVGMFVAAIFCGLGCSIAIAGLALLLSGNANAAPTQTVALPAASPGSLEVADGCSSLALEPVERDWHVRVDRKTIEVRMMQTWTIPEQFDGGVIFAAQLPPGASLRLLSAQSAHREWSGRIVRHDSERRQESTRNGRTAQDQITVLLMPGGNLVSEALTGLEPGESLTLQYTYQIHQRPDTQILALDLSLDSSAGFNGADDALLAESSAITATHRQPGAGSVWVEWRDRKPARLLQLPTGSALETTPAGIAGLSWSSNALPQGQRFQLRWEM